MGHLEKSQENMRKPWENIGQSQKTNQKTIYEDGDLLTGKRLHKKLKRSTMQYFMGTVIIPVAMFNGYVKVPEGIRH